MKIKLNTIEDINGFVNICSKYHSCDIDVKQERHIVNGKSILGIFSLNTLKPMNVVIDSENDDLKIGFYRDIQKWKEV